MRLLTVCVILTAAGPAAAQTRDREARAALALSAAAGVPAPKTECERKAEAAIALAAVSLVAEAPEPREVDPEVVRLRQEVTLLRASIEAFKGTAAEAAKAKQSCPCGPGCSCAAGQCPAGCPAAKPKAAEPAYTTYLIGGRLYQVPAGSPPPAVGYGGYGQPAFGGGCAGGNCGVR